MKDAETSSLKMPSLWSYVDTEKTESASALPKVPESVLEQKTSEKCFRCGIALTDENWPLYHRKHNAHWCRGCTNSDARKRYREKTDIKIAQVQEKIEVFSHDKRYTKRSATGDTVPVCYECGVVLNDDNWWSTDKKANSRWCKNCHGKRNKMNKRDWYNRPGVRERQRKANQEWFKQHPDYRKLWDASHRPAGSLKAADKHYRQAYGISLDEVLKIGEQQQWRCGICGEKFEDKPYQNRHAISVKARYAFMVDHSHKTGSVRGLLCYNCNTLIGHAMDSPEILKRAIQYLQSHA